MHRTKMKVDGVKKLNWTVLKSARTVVKDESGLSRNPGVAKKGCKWTVGGKKGVELNDSQKCLHLTMDRPVHGVHFLIYRPLFRKRPST